MIQDMYLRGTGIFTAKARSPYAHSLTDPLAPTLLHVRRVEE